MKKTLKKYSKYLPILLILAFSISLGFVSPATIVNYIGVENSYLFMFCVALLSGLTVFTGLPYPVVLVTLALGGLNPLLLGFSAATGAILGDCISYFIGHKSDRILSKDMQIILGKVLVVYDFYPKYLPILFFAYGTFSPFPNNIITLSSGMKKHGFWRTIIPLDIGNLFFCMTLAYFANFFSAYFK